jgi:hypothetical protein
MADHRLNVLVAAAALSLGIASEAAAGGCCPGAYANCGCGPVVADEMYLVNQGPVFSGPGHSLPRQLPDAAPGGYPYVGYVFTGYPYGLQNSGGYPRGFYSPFTGYPYVEPLPRGGLYTNYRQAPAYRRHIRAR